MTGKKIVATILVAMMVSVSLFQSKTLAFDTSTTNYINGGYYNSLLGDGDFVDINSMSASAIQSFLSSKSGYLASAPASQLGSGANGRSAAQIIYDAAHGYGEASGTLNGIVINTSTGTISPRAIIVTLQKEQSLVTRTDYSQTALDRAMGYGCPDSSSCNPTYAGFTNQVEWAAWQLRYNYEAAGKDASWWSAHYGSSGYYYVNYSRSHNWGSTYYVVTYKNKTTAALYRYTPHVGFGNYNFWRLMIDWFNVAPITFGGGSFAVNDTDSVAQVTYRNHIKLAGTKTTDVRAYLGGSLIADTGGTTWSTEFDTPVGTTVYMINYKDTGGTTIATKSVSIDRHKTGDINGDRKIDVLDLSLLFNSWNLNTSDDASINLNPETDNTVNILDLSLMFSNWGG